MPVLCLFKTLKGFEELLFILFPDTCARIRHRHKQLHLSVLLRALFYRKNNLTLIGVFHRVRKQIHDDLGYPYIVTVEHRGKLRIDIGLKFQFL